ncbi:hypothetical protein ACFLX0_03300 [Chloroflexota bacterium]
MNLWCVDTDIPYPIVTLDSDGITIDYLDNPGGIRWRTATEQG